MERTTSLAPGIVYDAAAVSRALHLPIVFNDPVPIVRDGEIVVCYGGWDLQTLRRCFAGLEYMRDQNWYDDKGWKAEAGYYRLLLPVFDSNGMTWTEQIAHLRTIDQAWQPASVAIAATAVLVHLTETGNDLLQRRWCRCAELLSNYKRAGLAVYRDRMLVDDTPGNRLDDRISLAAAQKC